MLRTNYLLQGRRVPGVQRPWKKRDYKMSRTHSAAGSHTHIELLSLLELEVGCVLSILDIGQGFSDLLIA